MIYKSTLHLTKYATFFTITQATVDQSSLFFTVKFRKGSAEEAGIKATTSP